MLAQPQCGYRYTIYICAGLMCCHRVYVQSVHSTERLQHPTQELATRVTTLILTRTRMN